ncbi:MAG: hypothetical protein ABSA30_08185, partial [Candidatus Aminicenantales bacterium]
MIKLFDRTLRRTERFFLEPIVPRAGFAVSRGRLDGLILTAKERRAAAHVSLELPEGAIEPSFDRPNIAGVRAFEDKLRDAARRLGLSGVEVLLLLPESCFKAYVLTFEEFPSAARERDELLGHRLSKLLPQRPADTRLSYDVFASGGKTRVFLALARASIVDEYERLFARIDLRVRTVSLPTLGLLPCIPEAADRTVLIVNIEEDSIGLLAATGRDVALYRFKPLLPEAPASAAARPAQFVTEIQNTLHFLEDHEGRSA